MLHQMVAQDDPALHTRRRHTHSRTHHIAIRFGKHRLDVSDNPLSHTPSLCATAGGQSRLRHDWLTLHPAGGSWCAELLVLGEYRGWSRSCGPVWPPR